MKSLLPAVLGLGLILNSSVSAAQAISERVREASQKPGTPVVVGVLSEPMRSSVQELTERSDLIVEARVSRLESRINAARQTQLIRSSHASWLRYAPGEELSRGQNEVLPIVRSTYGSHVRTTCGF
jgi:hypothetical protein